MEDIFWIISQRCFTEYLNKELTSCNNIRNSLINNKEQSISIESRIHAIDEDIAVINKALGRWKE